MHDQKWAAYVAFESQGKVCHDQKRVTICSIFLYRNTCSSHKSCFGVEIHFTPQPAGSNFGMHEQTDLAKLCTIDCPPRIVFVDTA